MVDNNNLKGLNGWLVVVGLGVLLSPVRLLVFLIPAYKPVFENGTWEAIITPGSELYVPYFGAFVAGEIAVNAIMVLASLYLIYLFFSKHYRFPAVFIAILAVSIIIIPLDAWLYTLFFPGEPMFDKETSKEFIRSLIFGAIWIPYMLVSKRVEATFVEKRPSPKHQAAIG